MDFARKLLGKYGWKEGDGLGKNNTGITAPLKASLKFDNAGLGADRAQEFNDHWWERCFNEAASNVEVQIQRDGKVLTSRKEGEDAVEISTSGYSARKLKKAKEQHASDGRATYDNFLQTSLLTQNGGEVETAGRINVEDIEVTKVTVLTDEELFKACGGRTAHKGARHGLKLSGKIARLEQQEREMLEKLQGKLKNPPEADPVQKTNRKRDSAEEIVVETQKEAEDTVELFEKPKKKKSKKSKAEEELPSEETPEEPVQIKKKKDKSKKPVEEVIEDTENQVEEPVKIKKKKADRLQEVSETSEETTQDKETDEPLKSKKKRKTGDSTEETENPIKSKKKKKRNQEEL
ncbi:G patch domain-containing protein 4 [Drosophila subpulchrella]|uniref:G patch domain-containing protein 4 n=1 Tax=Drosophila subpulchrella TaxID=1486046 RepID=UPI0018A1B6BA|nr:G patch domain-containing protein 4 [Drosophila subpulchrella]